MPIKMETQTPEPTPTNPIGESTPVGGEIGLLVPLLAPAIVCIAKATMQAITKHQQAKIEDQNDTREYLQQQNELLLREILDRSDEPKN